jgi:hypothetical protein
MEQSDYDSPWKDALDFLFDPFIALFFPSAHAQIDWTRGFEFLDKELQKITSDAAVGRRIVDKLVKVWLKSGAEIWALVHIEIQGQREKGFEWRLYVYNFRIHDRFGAPVATFVVLTDDDENWRPAEYRSGLLGTEVRFGYSTAKLLDYRERLTELEQSDNPFAVVIQAHLAALETRGAALDRLEQKLELTKQLYNRGFSEKVVIGLFRFLDWALWLPDDLETEFDGRITAYGEEQKMEYVTPFERHGIRKGIRIGGAEIILRQLQRRFGVLDDAIHAHVGALPMEQLEDLSVALLDFPAMSDLEDWLQRHPVPSAISGSEENGARREPGV